MTEPTYTFTPGSTPLLISVPHGGTFIPTHLRDRFTPEALAVPDTDWHVPRLYQFAAELVPFAIYPHLHDCHSINAS